MDQPQPAGPEKDPQFIGRHRIEDTLGRGGMGCVYRAFHSTSEMTSESGSRVLPGFNEGAATRVPRVLGSDPLPVILPGRQTDGSQRPPRSRRPSLPVARGRAPVLARCIAWCFGLVFSAVCANESPVGEVPGFSFDIDDGLYATITANSFKEPAIVGEVKVKLRPACFKKDIQVRVIWQAERRPLAVLIPGMVDWDCAKEAQLWKSHLQQAGYHVLTLDSPFLPEFNDRSRHGVIGNVQEESRLVAHLIAAFLEEKKAKDLVTQTGLVGLSYGGTLALNIAQWAAQKKIPFEPSRVLAFSPPVRMRTAARILDDFYAAERWNYRLADLARDLAEHKPVPKGTPVPFSASEMRAGIAVIFRFGLKGVVLYDDRNYQLGLLPKEQDEYRRDVAGTWTFQKFVDEMALPYWSRRAKLRTAEDFWAAGELRVLMKNLPGTVHVVLSADDPLNDPAELKELCANADTARLTVLPRGGHLGYGRTEWARARAARLFE